MSLQDTDTVENVKPALAAAKYFVNNLSDTLAFDFGAASHVGLRRSENQDHYLVLRRTRTQQLLFTNMPTEDLALPSDETHAIAVADGMGGSGSGGLASQVALRAGWELAGRTTSWIMKLENLDSHEITERIEGFVYMLQQAFMHEFKTNPELGNSGTTFTSAYFVNTFAAVTQVGDSPCFIWRDGTMRRISIDHTIEQEFISAGVAPEIAGKFSHMLTRCLGYESQNARPDVHFLRLKPTDQLLICTDGLTDMVSDVHIAQCLDESPTAQAACDGLVDLALKGSGKDNVTAVLARAKAS
ncbi:MAG TPA: PP2C family serine/threonine-protein phosphatase [Lacipirellulaceae bacterium]|jgi:protein phosphatase|nr:PP2C family serine/threonine-protein phosphatase [Lacipirellulaceae bacterium]